jgi:hypothetical protein
VNTFSSCSHFPVVVSFDLFVLPTRDGHLRTKEEQDARETSKVRASVKVVSTANDNVVLEARSKVDQLSRISIYM